MLPPIEVRIAEELGIRPEQVVATVHLIDEGSTVPFIARYRKEVTGALDDTQLRNLETRLVYLRELEERRSAILKSIDEQGKLSPSLQANIGNADTKTRLEDLYLPYKPKRRTKAQIAREAGLEPLALSLLQNPALDPQVEAEKYVDSEKGIADSKAALDGARQILMEFFSEDAELLRELREYLNARGIVESKAVEEKKEEGLKFSDYFEYKEALKDIPSHRALALFRGRNEGILSVTLTTPDAQDSSPSMLTNCELMIARRFSVSNQKRPADKWLMECVRWSWKIKLSVHLEVELMMALRERAEAEAIRVFGMNLRDLLLAAPAGRKSTIGLDPGIRTGVKVAVVDSTGKVVATATIYPHPPKNDWEGSIAVLAALAVRHKAELVSIGNGTASRETDRLTQDLMKRYPELKLSKIVVSEAGASVYSASETAAKEFPDLDVTLRGAVSIARRIQDPLAELVKIDPKAIGVGQYQHDVNQTDLAKRLDAIVEDCVNAVGVELNTASPHLLTRVSGLNSTLAENIVTFRNENGAFKTRKDLLKVPRLGEKTFEQAAGFLRIVGGDNPLDASAVHPEAYPVVERILETLKKNVQEVIGDLALLKSLNPSKFADERFGIPTVSDILKELEKPGRDPRPEFKSAQLREGVEEIKDLAAGMILEGTVTNVTNFGAFVDIGVHQDGLVHISAICDHFIKDPREVLKTGDIVKVKVVEVDIPRKRIGLSMKMGDETVQQSRPGPTDRKKAAKTPQKQEESSPVTFGSAFADAFAKMREKI